MQHSQDLVPEQGSNSGPLDWELGILTLDHQGSALSFSISPVSAHTSFYLGVLGGITPLGTPPPLSNWGQAFVDHCSRTFSSRKTSGRSSLTSQRDWASPWRPQWHTLKFLSSLPCCSSLVFAINHLPS